MHVTAPAFRRLLPTVLLCCTLLPLSVAHPARATSATSWTVTSTKDTTTPSAAHCTGTSCPTLRDALAAAHSGDTIDLGGLSGSITLSSPLSVTTSLTITGPVSTTLTVNGNQLAPTFWLLGNGLAVTISNLTISDGGCTYKPIAAAGGIGGGGIVMTAAMTRTAALTLTNTLVTNNLPTTAPAPCALGGGITMDVSQGGKGSLTLIKSTVTQNSATNGGGILVYGGVSNSGTANVTVKSSMVTGNTTTTGMGGGIAFEGDATDTLVLTGTTVSNNTAAGQAGVYLQGGGTPSLSVTNSTIEGNTSAANPNSDSGIAINDAGGIWVDASSATMTITNSSVVDNCGYTTLPVILPEGTINVRACPASRLGAVAPS